MKYIIFTMFFLAKISLSAQIVPDLPLVIEFHHPLGYKDSVVIGLSLLADEGFDEGLDIIDTTELQFPLDVRIFDPLVKQQIGGPATHNLKHAYLSIPKLPKGEIKFFQREFIVAIKTDSINFLNEQIDGCKGGGLGSTFFKVKTENLTDYVDRNTEGWRVSTIDVYSTQLYFNAAIDNTNHTISAYEKSIMCCGLNWHENIYNEIYLRFVFNVFNNLYVDILDDIEKPLVQLRDNTLTIETQNPYVGYSFLIFDTSGCLVISEFNIETKYYRKKLELNTNKIYFLNILNENKQIFFNHKFIMQ